MATRRAYSREDQGDLNTTSIATSRNVDFKDIDLSLIAKFYQIYLQ